MTHDYTIDDGAAVQLVKCVGCENFVLAADCSTNDYDDDSSGLRCPRCGTTVHPDSIAEFTKA